MTIKTAKESAEAEKKATAKPVLLSGGNPQIAKGDDTPVQAYNEAMPGWIKQAVELPGWIS